MMPTEDYEEMMHCISPHEISAFPVLVSWYRENIDKANEDWWKEEWFKEVLDGKIDVCFDFKNKASDLNFVSGKEAVDIFCEKALETLNSEDYFALNDILINNKTTLTKRSPQIYVKVTGSDKPQA